MKKIISMTVVGLFLCLCIPMSALAATVNNGDGTYKVSGQSPSIANKTLTITVMKGKEQTSDHLMYIDEFLADEKGNYSITFTTKEELTVTDPFHVKVVSEGTTLEEEVIHHPDYKPDEGTDPGDGTNPDEENPDDGTIPDEDSKPDNEQPDGGTNPDNEEPDHNENPDDGKSNGDKDKVDDMKGNEGEDSNNEDNLQNVNGDNHSEGKGENNQGGVTLPNTATSVGDILLFGALLVGMGLLFVLASRKIAKRTL